MGNEQHSGATSDREPHRRALGLAAIALCAALVGSAASPSWAGALGGAGGGEGGTAVVGGFGLGDALEGLVSERDGALQVTIPVAGLRLGWDSRGIGFDHAGVGAGWTWGLARVNTQGGVHLLPLSGGMFPTDPTHPSGLAGHGTQDLVFEQVDGVLPARPHEASAAEAVYAYVLHELGGVSTYFDATGDPVARIDAFGVRVDWLWDRLVPHRLIGVVDEHGVRTGLDWNARPGAVLVRPGENLPGAEDRPIWRIELDGGRMSGMIDPLGGRTTIGYADGTGLVSDLDGTSGATTSVAWRVDDDGVPRVERVRTVDAVGNELSKREWAPGGDGTLPSGWPHFAGEQDLFWSSDPSIRYETTVSDGPTRVLSTYNSSHLLLERRVVGSTPSGDQVLQEQAFTYPGTEGGGVADPASLPGNWSRPVEAVVTHRDAHGGARSESEAFEFDEHGRITSHSAADGTTYITEYDTTVPTGRRLAVGLAIAETATAPDGQWQRARHALNAEHTAVVATETASGTGTDSSPETVTGRVEVTVRPDGVVVEQRAFAVGDDQAEPNVTRWDERTDLALGIRTVTTTTGAESISAATTSETLSLLHGGVIAAVDAVGNTTRTDRDALGRTVEVTDALDRTTSTSYESAQADGRNAVTVTRPDGVASTLVRDAIGRPVTKLDNIHDGVAEPGYTRLVESRRYPSAGTTELTDAWGATTTSRQDVFGRTVSIVAPTGLVELTEYDDVTRTVTSGRTATGRLADAEMVMTQRLDDAGRVAGGSGARADGAPVADHRTEYDGFGRPMLQSDGRMTARTDWDAYGNPVRATIWSAERDDVIATSERRFDGFGNSLEKTLADDTTSRSAGTRVVDALGRTTQEIDQLGAVTLVEHTPDGLVERFATDDGHVAHRTYHPVTRAVLTSVITSPTGETVGTAYEHDPLTDRVIAVVDLAEPGSSGIVTEHDAHGNTTAIRYPDGATIEHRYDAHGRQTATVDIVGNRTDYRYSATGLMIGAVQHDRSGRELARVEYRHDAFGRVTDLIRGNDLVTAFEFTSASEIAREHTTRGEQTVSDRSYSYDRSGNLIRRIDTTVAPGTERAETSTTTYAYDALNRLVSSTERAGDGSDEPGGGRGGAADAVTRSTSYTLTAAGDIATQTVVISPGTADRSEAIREFGYDARGALTAIATTESAPPSSRPIAERPATERPDTERASSERTVRTQTFDSRGNLTHAADGTTYLYDAANRLVAQTTPDGTTRRTAYWPDGTRRSVTDDARGAGTIFHWAGGTLVNETSARDGDTVAYLFGTQRHARITPAAEAGGGAARTTYYTHDRHGNVTELTDATGSPAAAYRYSDYGVPTAHEQGAPVGAALENLERNPYGFAGEYTEETGSQFLRIRLYDPDDMRFASLDPAPVHNGYAFADLNPIMRLDPSGNLAVSDIINVVVIAVAVVSAAITLGAAAYVAGAVSLAAFGVADAIGVALDVGAAGIAAARITSNNSVRPMPSEVETWLERAEYLMAGFGIGIAVARIGTAITKWRTPPAAEAPRQPVTPITNKPDPKTGMGTQQRGRRHVRETNSESSSRSESASSRERDSSLDSRSDQSSTFDPPDVEQRTIFARAHDTDSAPTDIRDSFLRELDETKMLHGPDFRPSTLLRDIKSLTDRNDAILAALAKGKKVSPNRIRQRDGALQYVVTTFGWKVAHSRAHRNSFTFVQDPAYISAFEKVDEILTSIGYGAKQ